MVHSYHCVCLLKVWDSKSLLVIVPMNCSIPQMPCLQICLKSTETIYTELLTSKQAPLFLSQYRGSSSDLSHFLPVANLILLLHSAVILAQDL